MSDKVNNWPITRTTHVRDGRLILSCSRCNSERSWKNIPPTTQVRKAAIRGGWKVTDWKEATCPDCNTKSNMTDKAEAEKRAQIANRRTVTRYLSLHYDIEDQGYTDGWNDARIAKETGLAEAFVALVRDEGFGPAEDPRLIAAREELADLRQRVISDSAELRAMVDTFERESLAKIDGYGQRLAKLLGA